MSWYDDLAYEQDVRELAEWKASPEGRAALAEREGEQEAVRAARDRQEKLWKAKHRAEWAEWQRVRPQLAWVIEFGADKQYDFDDFLTEVGPAPSPTHRVVRKVKDHPYQRGNLRWKAKRPARVGPDLTTSSRLTRATDDFLTKKEVAARLQVSTRTVCRWRSQGLLKEFRRGHVLRFKREDVEAFEAKGRGVRR